MTASLFSTFFNILLDGCCAAFLLIILCYANQAWLIILILLWHLCNTGKCVYWLLESVPLCCSIYDSHLNCYEYICNDRDELKKEHQPQLIKYMDIFDGVLFIVILILGFCDTIATNNIYTFLLVIFLIKGTKYVILMLSYCLDCAQGHRYRSIENHEGRNHICIINHNYIGPEQEPSIYKSILEPPYDA